jgi:hypothetical protein
MDLQKNRLFIGALALVALGGLAIWAVGARGGETPVRDDGRALRLPDLERDQIAAIEITRPEDNGNAVRLERRNDEWWLTQPLEARADQSAVTTVLDKLDELEAAGVAVSNPNFHERLEVDPAHGVRVIVRGADGAQLADLWIGAYRSGSTMVRPEGEERVAQVRGSIKFAFNKEVRDWRDRSILNVEADDVNEMAWTGPNGSFRFRRAASAEGQAGEWEMAEISYVPAPAEGAPPSSTALTTIEGFAASKVRSMLTSLARMRASDFAAADVTPEAAGLGPESARVTITIPGEGDAPAQTHVVILGREANEERHDFYAQREGEPTIYVISRFLSERVNPTATSFTETAPEPAPEGAPQGDPHAIEGMPGMPGGGGQIPPEVMEQLRRQLEQQGLGGAVN